MFDQMYALWGQALAPFVPPAIQLSLFSLPVIIVLRLWVGRRRFERRNAAGVEQFDSYGSAVGNRTAEGLVDAVAHLFTLVFALAATVAVLGLIFARY